MPGQPAGILFIEGPFPKIVLVGDIACSPCELQGCVQVFIQTEAYDRVVLRILAGTEAETGKDCPISRTFLVYLFNDGILLIRACAEPGLHERKKSTEDPGYTGCFRQRGERLVRKVEEGKSLNEHLKNDAVVEVAGQWQSLDSFAIFSSATGKPFHLDQVAQILPDDRSQSVAKLFKKLFSFSGKPRDWQKFRLMENLIDLLKETGLDSA